MSDQALLKNFVFNASREQIVSLLSTESVPLQTLQTCAFVALGGDPSLAVTEGAVAAPAASNGASKAKGKGKPAAGKPAPAGPAGAVDTVVEALLAAGVGFSSGDVIEAASCTRAKATTALKRAMGEGKCKSYGDRRFARYGRTEAIAKAASDAARGA